MIKITDFDFAGSSEIEINDGSIKKIWVENSIQTQIKDSSVDLATGGNALIEFTNGKRMIITNSEWCSLNWL